MSPSCLPADGHRPRSGQLLSVHRVVAALDRVLASRASMKRFFDLVCFVLETCDEILPVASSQTKEMSRPLPWEWQVHSDSFL